MSLISKTCSQLINEEDKVTLYTDMYLYGQEMIKNLYVERCHPNREFFKDILDNIYYIKDRYYFGIKEDNDYANELAHKYKTAMTTLDNEEFCSFVFSELRDIEDLISIDYKEHIYLYKNFDLLIGKINELFTGFLDSFLNYYKASCSREAFSKINKIVGNINLYQYNDDSVRYPLASILYLCQKNHILSNRFQDHQLLSSKDFSYEDELFEQIEDIHHEELKRQYLEEKNAEPVKAEDEKTVEVEDNSKIYMFDGFSSLGLPDKDGNIVEPFSYSSVTVTTPKEILKETVDTLKEIKEIVEDKQSDEENKAKPNKDPDALVTPANPVIPSDNTRHGKDGVYISKATTMKDGVKIVNVVETKVPVLSEMKVDLSGYQRNDTVTESSDSSTTSSTSSSD